MIRLFAPICTALILVLSACASNQQAAVETAVAATMTAQVPEHVIEPAVTATATMTAQVVEPTVTATATMTAQVVEPTVTATATMTPIPIAEMKIEPLLFESGDLPPGWLVSDIDDFVPDTFNKFKPDRAVRLLFDGKREGDGGYLLVMLYESEHERKQAWGLDQRLHNSLGGFQDEFAKWTVERQDLTGIGEQATAWAMTLESLPVDLAFYFYDLSFVRCRALVLLSMSNITYLDALTHYASRLDQRLIPVVCP